MNVTRNAAWLLGCRISGDVLNLLFFVVISREYGPPGVGAYSYGFAVTGFVLVIGSMGIEDFGLREYARMQAAHRSQFIAELLGTQLVMIIVAFIAVGVYLSLTSPSGATLGIMASLAYYQASLCLSSALFIPAMGQQHMVGRALIDLLCRAVSFIYAGVAIYVWRTPVPQALLGYVLAATLLIELSRRSALKFGGELRISISRAGPAEDRHRTVVICRGRGSGAVVCAGGRDRARPQGGGGGGRAVRDRIALD